MTFKDGDVVLVVKPPPEEAKSAEWGELDDFYVTNPGTVKAVYKGGYYVHAPGGVQRFFPKSWVVLAGEACLCSLCAERRLEQVASH